MNKTQVKLLGGVIGGVFLLLLITSTFRNLFATNNQGYYQIKQAAITLCRGAMDNEIRSAKKWLKTTWDNLG